MAARGRRIPHACSPFCETTSIIRTPFSPRCQTMRASNGPKPSVNVCIGTYSRPLAIVIPFPFVAVCNAFRVRATGIEPAHHCRGISLIPTNGVYLSAPLAFKSTRKAASMQCRSDESDDCARRNGRMTNVPVRPHSRIRRARHNPAHSQMHSFPKSPILAREKCIGICISRWTVQFPE